VTSFQRAMVTTFGLGFMRPASGTWGSLPPAALAAGMVISGQAGAWYYYVLLIVIAVLFSLACVKFGDAAEAEFGKKDPGKVVADETAGMAITLLALPVWWVSDVNRLLVYVGAAFVLFRIADIIKAPPARGLQRLRGGWGILVDDLIAGVQAAAVLVAAAYLWR
jgi:phosphatidylglycerophosphatase A